MDRNYKLQRNIFIGYGYYFFMSFRLTNAVWVIYLAARGMSLTEIGILEGIFHITSFLCEVPTGALADIYGRKWSVIMGRATALISGLLMLTADSLMGFGLAFVFSALSFTLNSGAADSLTYDSLQQGGEEEQFVRIIGRLNAISEVAQAVAVPLGGWIADQSFVYVYLVAMLTDGVALAVACQFYEEPLRRCYEEKKRRQVWSVFSLSIVADQIGEALGVIRQRPRVFYLMVFSTMLSTAGTTVFFYCQQYFFLLGYSKTTIGLIVGGDSLIRACCSHWAHRVEGGFRQGQILAVLPVLTTVALAGLAWKGSEYGVLFFYLTAIVEGFGYPIFSAYINRLVPSEWRATLLSLESSVFSTLMIIFFPGVGYIGDCWGLPAAFCVLLAVVGSGIIGLWGIWYKWAGKEPKEKANCF